MLYAIVPYRTGKEEIVNYVDPRMRLAVILMGLYLATLLGICIFWVRP